MKLLKKYLFKTISQSFFPIFFTLFSITSIVYFVQIASLTSIIQINFIELLLLYSYTLPNILFYTMPISVFIALVLSFAKLSSEYELTVITSFGLNPLQMIKLIMPLMILITIFLLLLTLVVSPKTQYLKSNFIKEKKTEAQFNIKPSEYGQEFGKWLIYVNGEKDGIYEDIVLFHKDKEDQSFIVAKKAYMQNNGSALILNLTNGTAVNFKDSLQQIDFEVMVIYNEIKQNLNIKSLNDIVVYWQEIIHSKSKRFYFIFYTLVSFFPILSLMMIVSLGYYNPRYDKNRATVYAIVFSIIYFLASNKLTNHYSFELLYIIPIVWISIGYIIYRRKIKHFY